MIYCDFVKIIAKFLIESEIFYLNLKIKLFYKPLIIRTPFPQKVVNIFKILNSPPHNFVTTSFYLNKYFI